MKGDIPTEIEDLLEEEDHKRVEDLLVETGPPDGGGPPNDGGPPNGNRGTQDAPIDEDHQDLEDLLDQ